MLELLNGTRSVRKVVKNIEEEDDKFIYESGYELVLTDDALNMSSNTLISAVELIINSTKTKGDANQKQFLIRYFTAYQRRNCSLKKLAETCMLIYNKSVEKDQFSKCQNMRSVKKVNLFLLKAYESL